MKSKFYAHIQPWIVWPSCIFAARSFAIEKVMKIKSFLAKPFASYIYKGIRKSLATAVADQENILRTLIKVGRTTDFGKDTGLDKVNNYGEYKQAVTIRDYEEMKGYISRIKEGKHNSAINLLSVLREPNETHLGLSTGPRSRGHALGDGSASSRERIAPAIAASIISMANVSGGDSVSDAV